LPRSPNRSLTFRFSNQIFMYFSFSPITSISFTLTNSPLWYEVESTNYVLFTSSSFLGPNIHLRILFSGILSLCSSLKTRHQFSYTQQMAKLQFLLF
jgi:hypothetical protein